MTMPAQGTPWLLIFRVNCGACLHMPRLRSTRPVEYRPAFRLDRAATMSTIWIGALIQVRPNRSKTVTNGLVPALYSLVGSIETSSRIEPQ